MVQGFIRDVYRRVLPRAVRDSAIVGRLKTFLPHDMRYGAAFYRNDVDPAAMRSAGPMSSSLLAEFAPKSVADIGCGTGALLLAFRNAGCETFGAEYSAAGVKICKDRGLNVRRFNIETDAFEPSLKFDLAISMEVAEHLPARAADRYVGLLAGLARRIAFTAATPGQGGTGHINEQPHSYWIEKFAARGFAFDEPTSIRLRAAWKESGAVEVWYYNNLMIFEAR